VKLYYVPWPWDYHGQAAFIIKASTLESAIQKAKAKYMKEYAPDEDGYSMYPEPDYDKTKQLDGDIFVSRGCDC
jgi:hypothetical protein